MLDEAAAAIWAAAGEAIDAHGGISEYPTPGALALDLDPETKQTPALDLIDRALVDVAEGRCKRLMISMAPQEGKSERTSRRFPLWMLTRNPTMRIAIVSYHVRDRPPVGPPHPGRHRRARPRPGAGDRPALVRRPRLGAGRDARVRLLRRHQRVANVPRR